MKIIFITREGYNLSGARIRCYGFAKELNRCGIETEIFSFADDLGAKYGEKEFAMSNLDKLKYNIQAFKILLKKEKNSIFFMQRLNYHTLSPFLVSLIRKNRFVFDCDDWNIRENPVYYLGLLPSSKMEFLTRKIARYANICIAASLFLKEYLSRFNSKVFYLPTGVDTNLFNPKNNRVDNSKVTFSWLGTAYHQEMGENVQFIIDAFSLLADKYDNIFLDLAGEGRYFDKMRDNLDNHRHKNRIRFYSWINPDEIPDYLSAIDVGLLPLTRDTKFNRAKSPTKLFEYMAMAKPTVSSNISEPAYIINDGDNGLLAETKEEFTEKMRRLIEDSSLRQQMGEKARETIERNYSLKVLGKRLHEILKTV